MNPQAPKLPRKNSLAREFVEYIIDAPPNHEFTWKDLKGFYDARCEGDPYYTGMQVARLRRPWAQRVRRGVYVPIWLRCACTEQLLRNANNDVSLLGSTEELVVDGVKHTWGNCSPVETTATVPQKQESVVHDVVDAEFEVTEDRAAFVEHLYRLRADSYVLLEDVNTSIRELDELIRETENPL